MFDPMLETKNEGDRVRSRWAFPLSLLSHVAVIGLIVGASLMVAVSIEEPGQLFIIFDGAAPSPPPPPPPPRAGRESASTPRQVEEVPEPQVFMELHEILEDAPLLEEIDGVDVGVDVGVPGGDPAGEPGGIPGGTPNGEPGGTPDGILGEIGLGNEIPLIVTPEMTPPVLKRKLEPEYPEAARLARMEGRVILQAVISSTGRVEEVTILRSSNPLFDEAAIEAVEQWEYEPARQRGQPVAVFFTIDVVFSLR